MVEGDEKPARNGGPALQVIVLGSGGGPREDNTTAFLVRSVASGWKRGSVLAVDAGTHLAAIKRILELHEPNTKERPATLTEGPFNGLKIPHISSLSNAAYFTHTMIDTFLITHPHLDHITGFVVNTAALPNARPKKLAGLPTTIEAIKDHIFNNIIWPNLSDENNGAGLVTYMRLVDGGSPVLGNAQGRGYVEVCDGLSVKTWSVSHGHCIENHSHRGSIQLENPPETSRSGSAMGFQGSPRSLSGDNYMSPGLPYRYNNMERICVYNSSAHFIKDLATGREVLIFGDVEPDSLSLLPRNRQVWREAAPKVVAGQLGGIFIECSYDDSRPDELLFGHLSPRFLIEELKVLASEIDHLQNKDKVRDSKKRKRVASINSMDQKSRRSTRSSNEPNDTEFPHTSPPSPFTKTHTPTIDIEMREARSHSDSASTSQEISKALELQGLHVKKLPDSLLKGIKVVIIHVKDTLDDGPPIGDVIINELNEHDEEARLGCEFILSRPGEDVYL
ncbi:cAMP phosphodiesterases class-II-domain-containing protein [Xylogone sp. PMI_703]|nr:cAMP phosphodiesterases class-II-domain-containing protein [Xylogone sp. PMI_703]